MVHPRYLVNNSANQRFGNLTAKEALRVDGRIYWKCICSCGNFSLKRSDNLIGGKSTSCGCLTKEKLKSNIKHGHNRVEKKSSTYQTWHAMLQRCLNPKSSAYKQYGGAGIVLDKRWRSFQNFLEDMGERPQGTSLNRIKGAKLYSKSTCEWATSSVQGYDQKIRSTNKSGKTGVSWMAKLSKWRATIYYQNKQYYLGVFESFDKAVEVRERAELAFFGFMKD